MMKKPEKGGKIPTKQNEREKNKEEMNNNERNTGKTGS